MRRCVGLAVAVLLLVAGALPVAAQVTTGNIRGVVTDDTGAVLPGVTVTLQGANVPGSPTAVTNEQGVYRFPNLPPGYYDLAFELAGFSTVKRERIQVALGGEAEIAVQLKVGVQNESITVTGEAPVVDAASTQVATNYSREWVANAPVRRFTFFDLINAAPGVSASTSTSSRSQSFGSAANENMYLLDGTDFTAPLSGAAWPWPNTDAIEEIQVLSLGATADYGNVAGAVFNVVTRQGTNNFHGDANFYFQNQNLTGRNTTDAQDGGQPYNRARFRDSTIQVGGPVAKDKFWFFGSFQYQQDWDSQPGTPKDYPAKSNAKRYFYKLNYSLNPNNRLQFQVHDDFYDIPERATANNAPTTITLNHGHNPSPGLVYTGVINPTTVIEGRYSGFYGQAHNDPLDGGPRVARRFNDLNTGRITGGILYWYDGKSFKTAYSGKLTKYADDFLGGSHDFKVGVQYNSGGGEAVNGYNDYIYTYGTVPGYGYTQLPYNQGGRVKAYGVYADDTFRVNNRVTLNLGVRYDYSKGYFRSFDLLDKNGNATGQKSAAVDKLFDWGVASPRLGATFKLTPSGSSILKAHYGRYYRSIVTGEFDAATPSITPKYLFSGLYSSAGAPLDLEVVTDNSNLRIDSGFENPYTDQYIVALEQQIGQDIGFSVSYVHKDSKNQSAWNDIGGTYRLVPFTASGSDVTQVYQLTSAASSRVFLLTNDERMHSKYNGANFEVKKRMSHHWQGNFGLLLSKSEGRLGSSSARSTPVSNANSTAGVFGQNPNDFINSEGRLIGDRPVVVKGQVVFQLPANFTLSANMQSQSGRVIITEVRVPGATTRIPGTTRVVANAVDGSDRTKKWQTIDMRLEKAFKFGGTTDVAVFGDFLNLTNSDANESVLDRRSTNANYLIGSRIIQPRRLMLGAKFRF
ncbi:MAG: TonB-dependent receptor [Vicinamibacterales bacterium]